MSIPDTPPRRSSVVADRNTSAAATVEPTPTVEHGAPRDRSCLGQSFKAFVRLLFGANDHAAYYARSAEPSLQPGDARRDPFVTPPRTSSPAPASTSSIVIAGRTVEVDSRGYPIAEKFDIPDAPVSVVDAYVIVKKDVRFRIGETEVGGSEKTSVTPRAGVGSGNLDGTSRVSPRASPPPAPAPPLTAEEEVEATTPHLAESVGSVSESGDDSDVQVFPGYLEKTQSIRRGGRFKESFTVLRKRSSRSVFGRAAYLSHYLAMKERNSVSHPLGEDEGARAPSRTSSITETPLRKKKTVSIVVPQGSAHAADDSTVPAAADRTAHASPNASLGQLDPMEQPPRSSNVLVAEPPTDMNRGGATQGVPPMAPRGSRGTQGETGSLRSYVAFDESGGRGAPAEETTPPPQAPSSRRRSSHEAAATAGKKPRVSASQAAARRQSFEPYDDGAADASIGGVRHGAAHKSFSRPTSAAYTCADGYATHSEPTSSL